MWRAVGSCTKHPTKAYKVPRKQLVSQAKLPKTVLVARPPTLEAQQRKFHRVRFCLVGFRCFRAGLSLNKILVAQLAAPLHSKLKVVGSIRGWCKWKCVPDFCSVSSCSSVSFR
eukprot:1424586-Amphidinium_carterae.1